MHQSITVSLYCGIMKACLIMVATNIQIEEKEKME